MLHGKIWHAMKSPSQIQLRLANLPTPEFAGDLPVNQKRDDIAATIAKHQVVIVCGETGSGKTTQLPKICLTLKRGVAGMIGHTQPRRIAARSVAARIAQELKSPLGQTVGYKVRFSDKLSSSTYIKLMTDGILLAETQGDPLLKKYDTLIIDEAHERSLNIDFLLGYVKQLLPKRPDLKVIITSATIDAERFSSHFNGAPVIEVSGRTYPVEIRYRPLEETEEDEQEEKMEASILDAVDDLSRLGQGDILVFLPGEREIRDTAEHLRKHHPQGAEILPLFARLSMEDQQKVFRPSGGRRIVLATNVAETSLTVPGIKYVIDAGFARVNRYSPRAKVEQLQIEKISQAAAKQRAGRCGRVSNGICVRLYSEDDFNARPEFTEPEILRSSLASVILRMADLKLGDVAQFPFIEAPSSRLISDGYQLLQELGAVDEERRLTSLGSQLAKFPLDPKVGRMLLAAKAENCLTEILIIASALAVQDPRERPMDKREAADRAHARFVDERSDFLSLLKVWDFYDDALKHKKSNRLLVKQCHEHFLSFLRLKEWRELHTQISSMVHDMGLRCNVIPAEPPAIHRALLSGLLGNIGFKEGDADVYSGARGIKFTIAPGSGLKKLKPKWVMAAELMETAKLYARCVAKIEPDWIEPLAKGLAQSSYSEPRWDRKLAQVSAWERVTLYGITIVPKRRTHYGPIDPVESRKIFIREALANEEYDTNAKFWQHNRHLIAEVEELEHKARRQDVLVDEQQLFAFYDKHIPAGIFNGATFEYWLKKESEANPRLLFLSKEDLMRHGADGVTEAQFPESIKLGEAVLPLKYRFEPGHPLDGVTLTLPLHLLNQLDPTTCEWLVAGMIREKITHLIKTLPKTLRRVCVPVPDFVTDFLSSSTDTSTSLQEALATFIKSRTGLNISSADWDDKPPAHLLMNFRVVDDAGQELAMGRDWAALKPKLAQAAQLTFRESSPEIERIGLKQWDFGDLPQKLEFTRGVQRLTGYPALEDNGDSVAIRLFDIEHEALTSHRAGVGRLMRLELKEQMKQLASDAKGGLPGFTQYALILRNVMTPENLKEDLLTAIADRAFIGEDVLPRSNAEFMTLKQRARTRLPAVTEGATRLIQAIASEYQTLTLKVSALSPSMNRMKRESDECINHLLYQNFTSLTPWERLQHLPRYIKAIKLRLEKYPGAIDRDTKHGHAINQLWSRYQQRLEGLQKQGKVPEKLLEFRWLIEELRVSLFAQELKTPFPVSVKRLEKIWMELG
ncbi:MAG: ATP-dependent RNA helicase HrpA [Methylophilales bacterium]|nr:ATP-dependent RNA helicase HrpA [Methylophilales bacterium]